MSPAQEDDAIRRPATRKRKSSDMTTAVQDHGKSVVEAAKILRDGMTKAMNDVDADTLRMEFSNSILKVETKIDSLETKFETKLDAILMCMRQK